MVNVCLTIGIPSTGLEAMLDTIDNLALKECSQDWMILSKVKRKFSKNPYDRQVFNGQVAAKVAIANINML